MLLIILNIILIVYLIYSIKKVVNSLKEKYTDREVNCIIHSALLGIVGMTVVNIFTKTLVSLIDLIFGG